MNRRPSLRSSVFVLVLAGTVLLLATAAHAADESKDSGDDGTASTDDAANDVAGGDNDGGDEDDAGGGQELSSRTEAPPKAEATTIPLDAAALEEESEPTTKEAIETSSEPATSAVETTPSFELPQYRLTRNGETCILMVVDAVVVVTYENKSKESRTAESYMTQTEPRGRCEEDEAQLVIEWKQFTVKWNFMKTPGGERWYVTRVELQYDKSDKPFENAYRVDKVTLSTRQAHGPMLFPTPVGKSFHCQSEYTLNFASEKGGISDTATLLLRDFQMQPFMYKTKFGPEFECNAGGFPRMRDETAPIAVGSTLAVVVLLTVTGYGVYRYFKIKKVQYDTME